MKCLERSPCASARNSRADRAGDHSFLGGVGYDVLMRGDTDLGTGMMPQMTSYITLWGTVDLMDGASTVIAQNRVIHVMVGSRVRDANLELGTDTMTDASDHGDVVVAYHPAASGHDGRHVPGPRHAPWVPAPDVRRRQHHTLRLGQAERAVPCSAPMWVESEQAGEFNRRFGVRLGDGARVEAVLYRGDTLCVSTQVGCSVGCPFCASGAHGLARSLKLAELGAQLDLVSERGHEVKRVTLSGVGEPLLNPACVDFVHECRARRIPPSVTTSGGSGALLRRWLRLPHNGLTLSVHAGTEVTRERMVPGAPDLATLFRVLAEELPGLSRSRRKKLTLAYLLIEGENDSDAELDAFAARAVPLGLDVQLYAHNAVAHNSSRSPNEARIQAIKCRLESTGLRVRRSSKARREANGGCGTLLALGALNSRA